MGQSKGIEAGTLIGRIQLLQELNDLVPQSAEVLAPLPVERLALLEQDLQRQLRERSWAQGFAEATGVLEMIAKDPEERRLYNERLKMERDERARNLQARQEGFELGAAVERVQLLRELNGEDRGSADELAALGTAQLATLAEELQRRLRERRWQARTALRRIAALAEAPAEPTQGLTAGC